MSDQEVDWEKRYRDLQSLVDRQYRSDHESMELLRKDPTYEPVRKLVKEIEDGEYKPTPKEIVKEDAAKNDEQIPVWARSTIEYVENIKKREETDRQKKFQEWAKQVEEREKDLKDKYPRVPDEFIGPQGRINQFMAKHGIDDFDIAVRAIVPQEMLVEERASKPLAPHKGKPSPSPKTDEAESWEQASGKWKEEFIADNAPGG